MSIFVDLNSSTSTSERRYVKTAVLENFAIFTRHHLQAWNFI